MKRSLILVPIILLVVLNACGVNPGSEQFNAAVAQTLTALSWTPTFTPYPTLEPRRMMIVNAMNSVGAQYTGQGYAPDYGGMPSSLATNLDYLEESLGTKFMVLNVNFPVEHGAPVFEIQARCECGSGGNCCTAERMLVQTIRELYLANKQAYLYANNQQYLNLAVEIPSTVQWMRLLCLDHRRNFATVTLPWQDVVSFLNDQSNGYMLGTTVTMVP